MDRECSEKSPKKATATTGCKCSRTKCLKMYCECFAQGKQCKPNECACDSCHNDGQHLAEVEKCKKQILKRNPDAFSKKLNVASTEHRKGCTCKRSGCAKAYCECFQMGVRCSDLCKCTGCGNTHEKAAAPSKPERHRLDTKPLKRQRR